ncbi:dihydroorotate dehydrogenase [Halalkalibacter alkalisediminis]|uniref:Dihydroorotate dehydrogenase n=1 Tax=Halalkalibacter alkalisediminis TaxID=935616 RepID=A0ABV6NBS0_9BACI|nr:dihydroorotate dehydrogenase [Halalkalibacter alkalisediminis]
MPDWSYHVLFKPLLSRLPPTVSRDFIHKGMNRIASIPGGKSFINFLGREESSWRLEKNIGHLRVSNSIGISGKIDPHLTGTKAFTNLGFGFIEIGPVTKIATKSVPPTIDQQNKNIKFHDPLESIGVIKTIDRLKQQQPNQPIFIRLSGTVKEQLELTSILDDVADAFIFEFDTKESNLDGFDPIKKPIFLAITCSQVESVSLSTIQSTYSGLLLDEVPHEVDSITRQSHKHALLFLKSNHFLLPVITVGGVLEPDDALSLFDAGADLILLTSGYVFSGPGLPKRIKEAQLDQLPKEEFNYKGWGWYFLFGFSIMIGGLITLLLSMTTIILPYDEHFLEMSRSSIELFNERILAFMAHDRMTLAGTMISGGFLYMFLATYGVKRGLRWAKQTIDAAAIVGFLGILLFIGYGYFDWLHLLFWLILLPFYVIGFIKTRHIRETATSRNRHNHSVWKGSLFGQFCFVILGFSFVFGGAMISFIGVTNVFVTTDLLYLCMPPEMLDDFNQQLIPVIAHDRAGFGSALLSVGLLVLMISLWGFQQGNRWVWWTLFIGGIPAFTSGIAVHFAIGYTTFIHLLPAYFALLLYVTGLLFSYRYFYLTK